MNQQSEYVTKEEALQLVNNFIDRPGCLDVPVLEELFNWRARLTRWVAEEQLRVC